MVNICRKSRRGHPWVYTGCSVGSSFAGNPQRQWNDILLCPAVQCSNWWSKKNTWARSPFCFSASSPLVSLPGKRNVFRSHYGESGMGKSGSKSYRRHPCIRSASCCIRETRWSAEYLDEPDVGTNFRRQLFSGDGPCILSTWRIWYRIPMVWTGVRMPGNIVI